MISSRTDGKRDRNVCSSRSKIGSVHKSDVSQTTRKLRISMVCFARAEHAAQRDEMAPHGSETRKMNEFRCSLSELFADVACALFPGL